MARYNCRSCGFVGEAKWGGQLVCPYCNDNTKVGVAIAGWELAEVKLSVPEAIVPYAQQRSERELRGDPVITLARETAFQVSTGIRNLADMFLGRTGRFSSLQQIGLTPKTALPESAALACSTASQRRLLSHFDLRRVKRLRAASQRK